MIFYVHPYLGKWSNLTNIFQMGWSHQLVNIILIHFDLDGFSLKFLFDPEIWMKKMSPMLTHVFFQKKVAKKQDIKTRRFLVQAKTKTHHNFLWRIKHFGCVWGDCLLCTMWSITVQPQFGRIFLDLFSQHGTSKSETWVR